MTPPLQVRFCPPPPDIDFLAILPEGVYGLSASPIRVPPVQIIKASPKVNPGAPETFIATQPHLHSIFTTRWTLPPGGGKQMTFDVKVSRNPGSDPWHFKNLWVPGGTTGEITWDLTYTNVTSYYCVYTSSVASAGIKEFMSFSIQSIDT